MRYKEIKILNEHGIINGRGQRIWRYYHDQYLPLEDANEFRIEAICHYLGETIKDSNITTILNGFETDKNVKSYSKLVIGQTYWFVAITVTEYQVIGAETLIEVSNESITKKIRLDSKLQLGSGNWIALQNGKNLSKRYFIFKREKDAMQFASKAKLALSHYSTVTFKEISSLPNWV